MNLKKEEILRNIYDFDTDQIYLEYALITRVFSNFEIYYKIYMEVISLKYDFQDISLYFNTFKKLFPDLIIETDIPSDKYTFSYIPGDIPFDIEKNKIEVYTKLNCINFTIHYNHEYYQFIDKLYHLFDIDKNEKRNKNFFGSVFKIKPLELKNDNFKYYYSNLVYN